MLLVVKQDIASNTCVRALKRIYGGYIMNLSVKGRTVTVVCVCWLCVIGVSRYPRHLDDFIIFGVIPVIISFGIMWIRRGRKKVDGPE